MLAVCVIWLFGQGILSANDAINRPSHNEGDYWVFEVKEWDFITSSSNALSGKYEVIIVSSGKPMVFHISESGEKSEVSAEIDSLLVMIGEGEYFGGSDKALEFPLFPGKKWTFNYQIRRRGERVQRTFHAEIRVVDVENIKTPAGLFQTLKIVRSDIGGPRIQTYSECFYSPESKSLVKFSFDSSRGSGSGGKRLVELIEYGHASTEKSREPINTLR